MAYLKFKKEVKVVQLWHGTGTIKRFGQDVNTGRLKELEKKANSKITHLIVNSKESEKQYAKAFGLSEDKVFIYGLPRTDLFFDQDKMQERLDKFYRQYPDLKGKKLVLYAPTFRDQEIDHPRIALDTKLLCEQLPEDYVYLLRLHPFVEHAYKANEQNKGDRAETKNVVSMSSYADISTLLLAADYLITDYSSVIFEYCLRSRPMIFYAYDYEQFSDQGRGFYRPYHEFVPGPVVKDAKSIIELLKKDRFDYGKINSFMNKNYQFLDGKSAERLYLNIFSSSIKTG
jgi:CDP-ribitol ribitolphosphotransferase